MLQIVTSLSYVTDFLKPEICKNLYTLYIWGIKMGTNVSNNVNTTERTYKPQASQSGQKTSAQNSI